MNQIDKDKEVPLEGEVLESKSTVHTFKSAKDLGKYLVNANPKMLGVQTLINQERELLYRLEVLR